MIGSMDTCFLIDWSRYSRRGLLEEAFDFVYVTEDVLREVASEETLTYVSGLLARGFLVIYPLRAEAASVARRAVEISARDPRVPVLDPPEALALAMARLEGCVCLTENKGVLRLVQYYEEFSGVEVWRSLELLEHLYRAGLIEDLEAELERYSRETGHVFPKRGGR